MLRSLDAETVSVLHSVVANLDDGFALFDTQDCLVAWNPAYESLNTEVRDLLVPGVPFETLIREIAERGQIPQAVGKEEEWISARIKAHRAGNDTERQVNDGRWFLVRERSVPKLGGTVGLWLDITERKRAEDAVLESQSHLLDAFESISAGLALFDADERLILCNRHFGEFFSMHADIIKPGVSFEDIAHRVGESMFAAGKIDSLEEGIARRLEQFRGCAVNLEYQNPDDRWIRCSEFRTRQGGTLSVRVDITDQKNAEIALRESESRFRDFAEVSAELLWEMDEDLRFTFASPTAKEFGFSEAALLGRRREEARSPYVKRPETDEELKALRARVPYRNIERLSDWRDDLWVSVSGKPLFAENDAFLGFRGATRDITERKKAELELEESRNVLASILNALPIGVTLVEPDGRLIFANSVADQHLGQELSSNIGKVIYEYVPPDRVEMIRDYDHRVLETGESIPFFERAVANENRTETLLIGKIPIKRHQEVTGICTMAMDITDRVEAERAQRETQERLQQSQKMEMVGQLTGGIAHDFNNLMGIVFGNAELLEELIGENPEAQHHLDVIKKTIGRGAALTNRLLAYSRKQTLSPVSVDVARLISGLAELLQRTLGETVSLTVDAPSGLWLATIDPHQFENALVNLAINARDAMPDGGSLVIEATNVTLDDSYAVQADELMPGDYVKVSVSDNGTGIPKENLERVFEPFYTTKEVGKGSGLGLSMVYGFVKQSNGHVTVYSEVGHGTTINLYLPKSEETSESRAAKRVRHKTLQGTERVLVVEDDAVLREVPVTVLRRNGYQVVEAANSAEALAAIRTGPDFDLIFTDVVLPDGMNGVEIAAEAERLQPGVRILFTSGYTENAIVHNGKLDPGVNLVNKPYSSLELLEQVRAVLDRS